uniref:Alternative protein ZNF213 n=1 Tax=Homo sapiens TaxID=9606 RepID=L8E7Z8_HUMAN|nr:alternative protein ZNF213 [Homo sapiens]
MRMAGIPKPAASASGNSATGMCMGLMRPSASSGSSAAAGCGPSCVPRSRSWSCWCWSSS